jgi:hypothetical protein
MIQRNIYEAVEPIRWLPGSSGFNGKSRFIGLAKLAKLPQDNLLWIFFLGASWTGPQESTKTRPEHYPLCSFFESDSHEQQMDTVWLPVAIRKEHPPFICVFRWSSLHINTRTCIQWWTIPRTLLGSQHESSLGLIQKSDPYLDQLRKSNKHHQISIPSGNQRRCGFPNHRGTETFSPSFQSQRRV